MTISVEDLIEEHIKGLDRLTPTMQETVTEVYRCSAQEAVFWANHGRNPVDYYAIRVRSHALNLPVRDPKSRIRAVEQRTGRPCPWWRLLPYSRTLLVRWPKAAIRELRERVEAEVEQQRDNEAWRKAVNERSCNNVNLSVNLDEDGTWYLTASISGLESRELVEVLGDDVLQRYGNGKYTAPEEEEDDRPFGPGVFRDEA